MMRRFVPTLLLTLALAFPAIAEPAPELDAAFDLPATTGGRLRPADLAGKPYALFFGFTHCPEVCPLTLSDLALALGDIGPEKDQLAILFVTVDPERDTLPSLTDYLGGFDLPVIGLSGDAAETLATARSFKATYRKVPLSDGDYTMEHTAIVYLMDREGQYFDRIEYGEAPESAAEKLRRLIARSGA